MDALLCRPELPLASLPPFRGAGVYAIYYRGMFEPYLPLARLNAKEGTFPIYVGKAIPKGGRKGASLDASVDSSSLYKRLVEHGASIQQAESLDVSAFRCRYLTVDDIWISLGETLLLQRFRPLWNLVVEGFGNHDPGGGRYKGMRPLWDELHPGRSWALKCLRPKLSRDTLLELVASYMETLPADIHD